MLGALFAALLHACWFLAVSTWMIFLIASGVIIGRNNSRPQCLTRDCRGYSDDGFCQKCFDERDSR